MRTIDLQELASVTESIEDLRNLLKRISKEFVGRDLSEEWKCFICSECVARGKKNIDIARYRTSNDADHASPDDEYFSFPSAASIPNSMETLCSFLASPLYHPLIKAGVAQGHMLLLQPFSEGNERIGRILSSMILLRAGYTFFSDVSLSALIARRSYCRKAYTACPDGNLSRH